MKKRPSHTFGGALLEESWESEVDALSRSALLQGTVVPKFYESKIIVPQANHV